MGNAKWWSFSLSMKNNLIKKELERKNEEVMDLKERFNKVKEKPYKK